MLPENMTEWQYIKGYPEEWSGYEGFFKDVDEASRFINGLKRLLDKKKQN